MYQALLTRRYLTHKVMPLLSAVGVVLCTATILIVWSIMGGFLAMLLGSGRALIGDVAVAWPTTGFRHYEDLIKRLEADDTVFAATPIIETFGILNLPDGRNEGIFIKGVDGPSYAKVVDFEKSLWWKPIDKPAEKDKEGLDWRLQRKTAENPVVPDWQQMYQDGLSLSERDALGAKVPAAVLGIEVSGFNDRQIGGWYTPRPYGVRNEQGEIEWRHEFLPERSVTLNVFPMNRRGQTIDVITRSLPVANEFKTGLFEIDSKTVLVDLKFLQGILKMDAAAKTAPQSAGDNRYAIEIDPATGREVPPAPKVVGVDPARVTTVLVRGKPGTNPDQVKQRCKAIYEQFENAHPGDVPPAPSKGRGIIIQTWKERQGTMVAAVEKETTLVIFILLVVSLTVSFMILAIFWAMVSEKTKDIGILRAVGAGRLGIAWLWLRYGLLIGVTGSILGGAVAYLVVRNINPIHEWMGRALGVQIWDPRVYYFTNIPNEVVPWQVAVVVGGGVVLSVLGAFIPAWHAARMDPVKALRFE